MTMIASKIVLHQTSSGWVFANEAVLEKFVWENLQQIFGLSPLRRQYTSKGEICDILAVDADNGLVILELKNAEDRYLVQQLTRYYSNLLEEKPFLQEVDYSRPVRLISIAPIYHRHNLIDRKYNRLNIDFFMFSIVSDNEEFYLSLQDFEQDSIYKKHPIPYQPIEKFLLEGVSEPPELLIKWLGACTKEEQEGFLKVRSRMLSCNQGIKEFVNKKTIHYGVGKSKLCAEICLQHKTQIPILFLWLPTPSTYLWRSKRTRGRLRIWTDGQRISHVGHVPDGFGKMRTKHEWEQVPPELHPRNFTMGLTSHSQTPLEISIYLKYHNDSEKADFWDTLSTLAIEQLLKKQ
jgi:RecB family endonuclease NucS